MNEKIGIERPVGFAPKRLHLGAQLLGRQRGRAKRSKPTRIAYRSGQRRRSHARHGRLKNRVLRPSKSQSTVSGHADIIYLPSAVSASSAVITSPNC
jgi:hypothetical protein